MGEIELREGLLHRDDVLPRHPGARAAAPGAGLALLRELAAGFEANGVWECIGPGGYARVANNLSSACLPYAAWKKLRGTATRSLPRN